MTSVSLSLKMCSELCANMSFSELKQCISVTKSPKYTRLKRSQSSFHLCTRLTNPYIKCCHSHLLSVANRIYIVYIESMPEYIQYK